MLIHFYISHTMPDSADIFNKSARRHRGGGSAARRARNQPAAGSSAVQPGMRGGKYKPLSEGDMRRIHATALHVLEQIGIGDPTAEILDYSLAKGCVLAEDGRLRFPRALVEDVLAGVPRTFVSYGLDEKYDEQIEGARVYFSTSGESISILDYHSQCYRPSTLVDLYDAARLADQMQHIHKFGQPFVAGEYSHDSFVHDLNIAYAALAGTQKSISLGIAVAEHIEPIIALFDTWLGTEGAFLKRPFCTFGGCPIVSPLRFARENAEVLVKCAELGLHYDIACAPQAGSTAPAALAGTLVQTFAETLACLVVVNLIRPGTPMSFGMWPFISDLRSGSFSGGSGEEALLTAATAQLGNYYNLVTSIPAGMTDAKTMDAQAGYEKAITTTAVALAGGNDICAYPGAVGSLIAFSFEGMLIDNDMLGSIQRLLRGIEVNDETLSLAVIKETVTGSGHYLNHPQTLALMQSEYVYPAVADRRTPDEWQSRGQQTVYEQAHERVKALLANYYPAYIDANTDKKIRDRFPIRLQPQDMQAGNGRW